MWISNFNWCSIYDLLVIQVSSEWFTTYIQVSYRHRGSWAMIIPTHNATAENQAADHYGLLHNARGTRQREASSIRQSPKKGAISHIFTAGKVWEGFKVGIPLEHLKKPLLDFCTYTILYLNLLNLSILFRQTGRTRPKILWSGERWYHWSHGKHRREVLCT